jgi:hypothetical protein
MKHKKRQPKYKLWLIFVPNKKYAKVQQLLETLGVSLRRC